MGKKVVRKVEKDTVRGGKLKSGKLLFWELGGEEKAVGVWDNWKNP